MTTLTEIPKPSRPLVDMLNAGVISGGKFLDYGCGKGNDVEYVRIVKPSTLTTGFDPTHFPKISGTVKYDTVFCSYVINYIEADKDIMELLNRLTVKLSTGGTLIVVARTIAEVKGNVSRNKNWKPKGKGFISESGKYQKGYDRLELEQLVSGCGLNVVTNQYDVSTAAYSYVIAKRN